MHMKSRMAHSIAKSFGIYREGNADLLITVFESHSLTYAYTFFVNLIYRSLM